MAAMTTTRRSPASLLAVASLLVTSLGLLVLVLPCAYAFAPAGANTNGRLSNQRAAPPSTTTAPTSPLFRTTTGTAGTTGTTKNRFFHNHKQPSSASSSATALMGIPKMFRWLTDQYPSINRRLSEGLASKEYRDVDNFYLDMNGIIHPCTHGNNEQELVVLDETAMFRKIFLYVDKMVKLVQPKKVLYLAVDGVAPRAKMNQQRSRRFRSSKEAEQLQANLVAQGKGLSDGTTTFDSNCITPGTDFMLKLSLALSKWVEYKQKTDPVWKYGPDVVVSGPDVPGEGEHKVMDFIRDEKAAYMEREKNGTPHPENSHWEPNLKHILYGLDADLIMLGLVTHEPNFMLLREKMSVVMSGRRGGKKKDVLDYDIFDFEVLELQLLRELFNVQFKKFADRIPGYDKERVIDDFVFLCMLVGNDFLPHAPHLEIDNGALNLLLGSYMDLMMDDWNGFLTNKEKIHPERLESLLYHTTRGFEEEHFKRRGYEENSPGWQLPANNVDTDNFHGIWYNSGRPETPETAKEANAKLPHGTIPDHQLTQNNQDMLGSDSMDINDPNNSKSKQSFSRKEKKPCPEGCKSYRDYYYDSKLHWSPNSVEGGELTVRNRRAHVRNYIEGLHWVLNYYHNGCQSWDWYFPHLYAPLMSDMYNLHEFYESEPKTNTDKDGFQTMEFEKGTPFPSLAQLLSVLPPQSANLLPEPLGELMLETSSPLVDFYPRDFSTDANGKRQSWEAVVEIPFIDGERLLGTVQQILHKDETGAEPLLSNAERRRNVLGVPSTFSPAERNTPEAKEFLAAEQLRREREQHVQRPAARRRHPSDGRRGGGGNGGAPRGGGGGPPRGGGGGGRGAPRGPPKR